MLLFRAPSFPVPPADNQPQCMMLSSLCCSQEYSFLGFWFVSNIMLCLYTECLNFSFIRSQDHFPKAFRFSNTLLKSGFLLAEQWSADDIVEVYTFISASKLSNSSSIVSKLYCSSYPSTPGLISVVSQLCHIFSLYYNSFCSASRRFKSFFITFSSFYPPNNFILKLHRQFLGPHDSGTDLLCCFSCETI